MNESRVPWDDEPYTSEERATIESAFEDAASNISLAQAEKELADGETTSLEFFLHSEDV